MRRPTFLFVVVLAALIGPHAATAQRDRHPEADEYIKMGTRVPPLPPGEGGQLFVSAPAQFCTDHRFILEINHIPPGRNGGPVAKALAGPSDCHWQFDDMPPGDYIGNLTTASDDRIVATARVRLTKGAAGSLVLAGLQTEIEGVVRINDSAPPAGLHLIFRNSRRGWLEWDAPFDSNGAYKVAIATAPDEQMCIYLQREPPMNSVPVKCSQFVTGLQRLDIDATMPRGVLRIDIPPVPDAGFGAFARITISDSDDAERGYLTSFKLIRGLRGDYITDIGRDYRIVVTRYDDKAVLASVRLPLSAERADVRVRLPLAVTRDQR